MIWLLIDLACWSGFSLMEIWESFTPWFWHCDFQFIMLFLHYLYNVTSTIRGFAVFDFKNLKLNKISKNRNDIWSKISAKLALYDCLGAICRLDVHNTLGDMQMLSVDYFSSVKRQIPASTYEKKPSTSSC
jgi:hypothetical protein